MSLAHLRDGPLNDRKIDRAASLRDMRAVSLRKRTARLRSLNAVTTLLTQQCGLAPSIATDFDASPPRTPLEDQFLDATDITKGRYFQESLLPFSFGAIEQNPCYKRSSSQVTPTSKDLNETTDNATTASEPLDVVDAQVTSDASATPQVTKEGKDEVAQKAQVPTEIASMEPPSREPQETPRHRPRTAHLPPQEVQEERFREKQLRLEARRRSAAESASLNSIINPAANAPSATADPSFATNIGGEAAQKADHSESGTQQAKSTTTAGPQRDSLLESQKEIARRDASGHDLDSPDVQLRLEQEQAAKATRDAAAALNSASAAPPTSVASIDSSAEQLAPTNGIQEASQLVTSTVQPKSASPVESTTSETSSMKRTSRPSLTNMPSRDSALLVGTTGSPGRPADINTTPARMTTRVSSGAMRQKSVSEILSDPSRISFNGSKRLSTEGISPTTTFAHSKPNDNQVIRRQQRPSTEKVHPPAPKRHSALLRNEGYTALKGAAEDPSKDYLEPLFRIQIHEPPSGRPLHELLQKSSKVVSTSDQFAGIHEKQDQRILRRIYQLQNANRWSLRQMEPCLEPAAPKTHMDHLLAEMKWMRTDFRQERKMKKATAKYLAEQCAEWVNADRDVRQTKQVRIKLAEVSQPDVDAAVPHSPADTNAENGDRHSQGGKSPPELDESINDAESTTEDLDMPQTPQYATIVPSSFFPAINMDKDSLYLQESDTFHNALSELPLLAPFEEDQSFAEPTMRRPVPAVSKFCEGRIMTQLTGPPRKRSRYDYVDEDELLEDASMPSAKRSRASQEESGQRPEQTDVALFDPDNKNLRLRLHANTAFRPPSEFQMPSSQFYEFRTGSQWTEEDQQLLRRLAREYSFNWSLIADELSLPSRLTSAADRRTPWECFERWVELESLPNEMRKTLYFKTWNQRLETANRNNESRYQAQLQQQAQTPGQPQTVGRRKTSPFKVDKRRQNRYLHTIDAMRKLARKREQQAHKHAEAQKAASMRKQHENAAPKSGIPSPQEFSRMRQERDVQIAARQERYREQVLAQQRAAQMQRAGQFPGGQQIHSNAGGPNRPGSHMPHAQNTPPLQINHQASQTHPHAQHANAAAAQRNGHLAVPQMGMQGNIPQAQMQSNMRAGSSQAHGTPDNMQQRILEAQRAAQLKSAQMNGQQYQMAPPNRLSPGGVQTPNGMMGNQSNSSMMNAMQATSSAPNRTSMQQGQNNQSGPNGNASASPHMPPPPTPSGQAQQPQQLSSGHIPAITQISHQLQAQHPQATPEKIKEMTNEQLRQLYSNQQSQNQARQSALNAATGAHSATVAANSNPAYNQNQAAYHQNGMTNGQHSYNNNNPPNGSNHQQYAQHMRQQLLAQQNQIQQQSPRASTNGSPRVHQLSPNMTHPSPQMAQSVPSNVNNIGNRTPTPQMARIGSSGGVTPSGAPQQPGMQSPGMQQGSPRPVPAGVARQ